MKILRGVKGQSAFLFVATVVPLVLFISITTHDVRRALMMSEDSQCPAGGHRCNENSSTCIHHSQWCDEKVDCPSAEDEDRRICLDSRSISQDMTSCMRDHVPDGQAIDFEICTGTCKCRIFRTISCRRKELLDVPRDLPNSTLNLILSMNNISDIRAGRFQYMKFLQSLYLDHNLIRSMAVGSFADLKRLERLMIQSNILEEILPNVLICPKLKYLDLSHNRIRFVHAESFNGLPSLGCLMLEHNMLGSYEPISIALPPKCSYLDLSFNDFKIIRKSTLSSCAGINTVLFERNAIVEIENNAFEKCTKLTDLTLSENNMTSLPSGFQAAELDSTIEHLDLANNPIHRISQETFKNLPNLFSLNLSGVSLMSLNRKTFQTMKNILSVEFSSFEMCRYAPNALTCRPKTDGISTIYNLLGIPLLGSFVWIVAVVTCCGNLLVMISRTVFQEENIHSMFIKNLAAADFMLGIYLLVIGSHDLLYRHQYNRFALEWTIGWTCRAAGFMGVMSIEVSVFILTSMSVECCLTVCFPLKPRAMTSTGAVTTLGLIWTAGFVVAVLPVLFDSKFGHFYDSNGVCLPLYVHDPYMDGWQYSSFVFNFVNVVGMLIIVGSYSLIFCNMRQTRSRVPAVLTNASGTGRGSMSDDLHQRKMKHLDVRLFVIVLTNVSCWIPVSVVKLMALYSVRFPSVSHAWLTIFVIPINSALNPIIYSITTPTFRKKFKSCCNFQKVRQNIRNFISNVRTNFRGTSRPRYMSKVSGGTAMSFLGLQDILLLQRQAMSSVSSQNRNEEDSFDATLAGGRRFKRPRTKRNRAFSLTGAEVLMAVPRVGWSMIPRRNSAGPSFGEVFRETFVVRKS